MLTVSSSALGSFAYLTNGRVGFSLDLLSPKGGLSGPLVRFFLDPINLLLVLVFIIHVGIQG